LKKFLIKYILIFIGFLFVSSGLAFILRSQLGMGPWGALEVALSSITGLSVGRLAQIISLCLIVVAWLMGIKPSLTTILNMVFIGQFLDMFLLIIPVSNGLFFNILFFVIGILIYSFGISMYMKNAKNDGPGPREGFMLALSNKLKISLRVARIIIDISVLVSAFVLKGPIGFGTIIFAFSAGPLIQFFLKISGYKVSQTSKKNEQVIEETSD